MGEAKQKREAFKQLAIKQIERWNFPASDAERDAVVEIEQLPMVEAVRYPPDLLAHMGMKQNECHTNARFMEDNDPEGKCRQITGYWPQAGNYVLHSIVERDGVYFCVTPQAIGGPLQFSFIPDPDIEWKEEDGYNVAYRKGVPVEPGFRTDPEENLRISKIVLARIEAGMHPLKAGEPPF